MLASKRQLQVEVENLEARLQMVAAAKTTSNYQFDDSQLGRVKELVSNLRSRLEVAEKLVNAEVYYHDEIPLDKAAPENIVEQVTEHFAAKTPAAARRNGERRTVSDPGIMIRIAVSLPGTSDARMERLAAMRTLPIGSCCGSTPWADTGSAWATR